MEKKHTNYSYNMCSLAAIQYNIHLTSSHVPYCQRLPNYSYVIYTYHVYRILNQTLYMLPLYIHKCNICANNLQRLQNCTNHNMFRGTQHEMISYKAAVEPPTNQGTIQRFGTIFSIRSIYYLMSVFATDGKKCISSRSRV